MEGKRANLMKGGERGTEEGVGWEISREGDKWR